ncbi:MAG: phosphotransferase family protein, partial [Actinomycetota bacterium]|nr:phosphotransferase family protein [Actinomycetota bacterium]
MSDVTLAERSEAFLTAELGAAAAVEVDRVTRVTTGRSRENWLFDATWTEGSSRISEELIVRIEPAGGLVETDRGLEFAVLQALEATSVPALRAR